MLEELQRLYLVTHISEEYLDLKNYKVNPHRDQYGWTSNNSIFEELGMDYTEVSKRIVDNGEQVLAWLDNMRKYSRMKNGGDDKDHEQWVVIHVWNKH